MIEAKIVCDSVSEQGHRLTTFRLRYPKFIHGEFLTHRVISRNASSSRAIPTAKLIEEVRSDALRAGPVFWGANQKGMQAAEELDDTEQKPPALSIRQHVKEIWKEAAFDAAHQAERMMSRGVHKQIVNRLLEPFSHINVVATATEWDNFWGLRLHKDAQPEMRALAIAMWEARKASTPKLLEPGQWHLPFILHEDMERIIHNTKNTAEAFWKDIELQPIKVSVARCARVSYESFETGKRSTVEEDLKLYDRLVGSHPMHASPAEHQATPDTITPKESIMSIYGAGRWTNKNEWGNFQGWRQFRQLLSGQACAPIPEEFR